MRWNPNIVNRVTQSQASWTSDGSWGSSVSHCSAGTLGGKGLCPLNEPVFPPWAQPLSPPLPSVGVGKVSREGDGPQAPASNTACRSHSAWLGGGGWGEGRAWAGH